MIASSNKAIQLSRTQGPDIFQRLPYHPMRLYANLLVLGMCLLPIRLFFILHVHFLTLQHCKCVFYSTVSVPSSPLYRNFICGLTLISSLISKSFWQPVAGYATFIFILCQLLCLKCEKMLRLVTDGFNLCAISSQFSCRCWQIQNSGKNFEQHTFHMKSTQEKEV